MRKVETIKLPELEAFVLDFNFITIYEFKTGYYYSSEYSEPRYLCDLDSDYQMALSQLLF